MLIPDSTQRRMVIAAGAGTRVRCDKGEAYCIYDNAYASARSGMGMELADRLPRLSMVTCDVERLGLTVRNTVVEVAQRCRDPERYRIRNHEPDGTGISLVWLDAMV